MCKMVGVWPLDVCVALESHCSLWNDQSNWQFFVEALHTWGPLMSGTFSVPFAALAVFSEVRYGPLIWGAMAYCALGVMGYLFYKRAQGLQERLTPKISAIYDTSKPPCRSVSEFRFTDGRLPINGMVYRIEVENISAEMIHDCEGYLAEVAFEDETAELGVINLPWSGMYPQALRVDLRPNVKRQLDLIVVYEDGKVSIISPGSPPNNRQDFFSRCGRYRFTVVIGGAESTLPPYKIRLFYTGDWQSSTMEII